MVNESLYNKTIKGLMTMSISSVIVFVLQFLTTLVLARIFTPKEFGIVSAVTIITSYTDIFWNVGVGPAIIQKKDLQQEDIRTGFTSTMGLGLLATIAIVSTSSLLIKFINIENAMVLNIIAFSFIINSFGVVPISILKREMRFDIVLKNNVIGSLCYAVVAIILGIAGLGVWALVTALLLKYVISTVIAWLACPIKLSFGFNKESFKQLIKFGFGYSLSQFFSVTAGQGDYFVVTRVMGSYALGIYNRAFQLMIVPVTLFGQVIDQVFFPVMSKIQDDNRRLCDIFILVTALLALLYFPMGAGIYLFSKEIVLILLGPKWIEATIPLRILSLSLFFRVGYKISDPLFRAKGVVYNRALIQLIQAIMVIITSFIGVKWGLFGVSVGVTISFILNYIIITRKTHELVKFKTIIYLRCVLPAMIVSDSLIVVMICIKKMLNLILLNENIILICMIGIFCVLVLIITIIIYYIWPESIRKQCYQLLKSFIIKFNGRIKSQ